ncbi:MAG: DUF3267 domain-containing protein [Anaeroplasma sp.]
MNRFYKELPDNYEKFKTIDANKISTGIFLNLIAFIMIFIVTIPFFIFFRFELDNLMSLSVSLLVLCILMLVYLILHELVHGLFYKIFTKEKLTFGLSFSVAYCGVPNLYVSKMVAIISALAPFVIFSIVFLLGIFIIPNDYAKLILIILFGIHFGGCFGDLYVSFLLLKNKGKILMNDTGPKQTFYRYNELLKKEE